MKELELEDDLLNKPPVRCAFPLFRYYLCMRLTPGHLRTLRAKLYKDSFEFVRNQRIQCLTQGAWFVIGNPLPVSVNPNSRDSLSLRRSPRPWRFFRLVGISPPLHPVVGSHQHLGQGYAIPPLCGQRCQDTNSRWAGGPSRTPSVNLVSSYRTS